MPKTELEKSADAKRKRLDLFYRITPEEEVAIEQYQRAVGLYIVMGPTTEATGTDHDHTTGLIRGRLDFRLNRALGLVEAMSKSTGDSVSQLLHALAKYYDMEPATQALGSQRFGLIGKAKRKKRMVYGSPNGPLPVEKKVKKPKKTK